MGRKIITDTQIAEAEKLANQALNRLKDMKAQRKAAERSEKRKRDDKRKYLLGALAVWKMQTDADYRAQTYADLEKFLTRDIDRAIFPELQKQGG